MSPEYVRPYIRGQKNDDNDAAGIAEAATRPTMRFVELKSQDRLDLQTLHRARSRLIAARKALVNQLRAILLERGHTFRQGRKVLEREIDPFLAEPPSDLSTRILTLIGLKRKDPLRHPKREPQLGEVGGRRLMAGRVEHPRPWKPGSKNGASTPRLL